MKAAREFLQSHWPSILLILGVLLFISLVLGYVFGWEWVGVVEYTRFVNGELVEIQRQKTLWDWLDLLIIPAVLAVGAWWLNKTQREAEREEAEKNREEEKRIAQNRREQETLESYFDRMTELLLTHGLREKSDHENEDEAEVQTIARARTLAVLRALNPRRKGTVIRFLSEAQLINGLTPIISLYGADLEKAELERAGLWRINLYGANLRRANLESANLTNAIFLFAQMQGARLKYADLTEADLAGNLQSADLQQAQMQAAEIQANLTNADLRDADLKWASFLNCQMEGTKMQGVQLQGAHLQWLQISELEGANFTGALYCKGEGGYATKWPERFDPEAAGAILVDEEGKPVEEENEQ